MKSDDTTRRIEPAEDRDDNIHVEHEVETEAAEVHEPQPTGWAAQLRQRVRLFLILGFSGYEGELRGCESPLRFSFLGNYFQRAATSGPG
jgi:hypothetical protein